MKKWWIKLGLLGMSIGISLLGLEIYLRLFNPLNFRLHGNRVQLEANYSKIIRNQPGDKMDEFIVYAKNSLGFRGEEPPRDFGKALTLVTVGGSTTESVVLGEGQTWTDWLGARLGESFADLWINNSGVDGHSTVGHLSLMRDYIGSLRPDVVLFLVGINDERLEAAREFDSGGLTRLVESGFLGRLFRLADKIEIIAYLQNIYRWKQAEAAGLRTNESVDFSTLSTLEKAALAEINPWDREVDYRVLGTASNSGEVDEGALVENKVLEEYRERLLELVKISLDAGIEPILITQPAVYGEGVDPETGVDLEKIPVGSDEDDWLRGYNGRTKWQILERYNQVTREVARDRDLMVIDLARKMPKNSRYYYDLIHFSKDGAVEVAEIIYADLCPYLAEKYPDYLIGGCEIN